MSDPMENPQEGQNVPEQPDAHEIARKKKLAARKRRKRASSILLCLLLTVFLISAWRVYSIEKDYDAGTDSYESLEQYISFEQTEPTVSTSEPPETRNTEPAPTEPTVPDDTVWPEINFDELQQINPDIVGWLYIEGTKINYPVVQGTDNDFYLNHLFDKSYNPAGCLFLDAANESDFSGKNSNIYGHHMINGTMLQNLVEYKSQSFYDTHTIGLLITPTNRYKIHFFSGYVAATSESAWEYDFSETDYELWLQEILEKSCFVSEVMPGEEDRVLTLTTCTYEFHDARFVLHGILEDRGRTPD